MITFEKNPRISEEMESGLLSAVGIGEREGQTAGELFSAIGGVIDSFLGVFSGTGSRHIKPLNRLRGNIRRLLASLDELSVEAQLEILVDFTEEDRSDLEKQLGHLDQSCEFAARCFPDSNRLILETPRAKHRLVRLLIPVFDHFYTKKRRGSGTTLRRDREDFLLICLSAAGVTDVPDTERFERDYVRPACRAFNQERAFRKRLAPKNITPDAGR